MKKVFGLFLLILFVTACSGGNEDTADYNHPEYDLAAFRNGDYFAIPFPHFKRVEDGKIDIHDFPGFADNTMLRRVAEQLEQNFSGFGLNSAIFVPFSGDLSSEFLSTSVTDTIGEDSPIFLVNITPDSVDYGKRVPILLKFYRGLSKYLPTYTLIVMPVPGFPLDQDSWYALVLRKGIKDAEGRELVVPEDFKRELEENLPPYSYLSSDVVDRSSILFAVPFKTGDAVSQMESIAKWYESLDEIRYDVDPILRYAYYTFDPRPELEGVFLAPQFQSGEPPYLKDGEGAFVFDSNGQPVPQRWEWVRFSLLLPDSPPPPGGYPIVIYAHGTGGDYQTYIWNWVGYYLTSMGYAVIGFDQPLHGTRNPRNGGEELYTFNFINPVAMRDNIRQGAADLFAVRKLVEEFSLSATDSPTGWTVKFDLNRLNFFGHSQGALTGAIYLGVEDYP